MGRDLQTERLSDRQRMRALQRLGTDTPHCLLCGEVRVECLERHHVAGVRSLLERYAVLVEELAVETVILCANCHRCVSDPASDQDRPERAELAFTEGLAELLRERARWLRQRCERLAVAAHR